MPSYWGQRLQGYYYLFCLQYCFENFGAHMYFTNWNWLWNWQKSIHLYFSAIFFLQGLWFRVLLLLLLLLLLSVLLYAREKPVLNHSQLFLQLPIFFQYTTLFFPTFNTQFPVSQNHRTVEVTRHLHRSASSNTLLKAGSASTTSKLLWAMSS